MQEAISTTRDACGENSVLTSFLRLPKVINLEFAHRKLVQNPTSTRTALIHLPDVRS